MCATSFYIVSRFVKQNSIDVINLISHSDMCATFYIVSRFVKQNSIVDTLLIYLQDPFNRFEYSLIGDGSATTYFEISQNGEISTKESVPLSSDTRRFYTVSLSPHFSDLNFGFR